VTQQKPRFQAWFRVLTLGLATGVLATCVQPPNLLQEVRALGELRVVTRDGPNTYYDAIDGPAGPEYDLLKGFAKHLGVKLRLTVVDRPAEIVPTLQAGRVHLAAAALSVNPETERLVNFGPAYQQVTEHVVYKSGRHRPIDLRELRGKRLEVPAGTSYVETLRVAQARDPGLIFTENPHVDQSELLRAVAHGKLDYTVVKSTAFSIYSSFIPDLRVAFDLAVGESLAWAFPKRYDRSLIDEADEYFEGIRATGELDRILDQYYGRAPRIDRVGTRDFMRDVRQRLPMYRALFQQAGEEYGVDWRLLAAIGYQESNWDPEAVSSTGVRGLMMLTEETAALLNVQDRTDAGESIRGGSRYFADILSRMPSQIPEPDRTWLALASYNMGYGHVLDAQRFTRSRGGDSDRWLEVRPNIKLLADPDHCTQARHGCARGGETVAFVDNIRMYYDLLAWASPREGEHNGWADAHGQRRKGSTIRAGVTADVSRLRAANSLR
jgi:membrane-bound lytic murein transglycosylase F